jgi:hypothetical protein
VFSKKENKTLPSRAENLWHNICVYRKDSAKLISKYYEYDLTKILENLQIFPQIKSYSGHRSGKQGDDVNKSAMKVLDEAILYLKECISNLDIHNYMSR